MGPSFTLLEIPYRAFQASLTIDAQSRASEVLSLFADRLRTVRADDLADEFEENSQNDI